MTLDRLIERSVPIEWWGVRPAVKWIVAATLSSLAYLTTLYSVGWSWEIGMATVVCLSLLLVSYRIIYLRPGKWRVRFHSFACILVSLPAALGLFIVLVILFIGLRIARETLYGR